MGRGGRRREMGGEGRKGRGGKDGIEGPFDGC